MEKLIRNGEVAVAVSPGYGAGWSTWNDVNPMDARFNILFDQEKLEEAADLCDILDLGFSNGAHKVRLVWVPVGTKFIIDEYDGFESIQLLDEIEWLEA